jgi:hypothetical protein
MRADVVLLGCDLVCESMNIQSHVIYTYMHIYIYICINACLYVCIYMCVCAYVCMYDVVYIRARIVCVLIDYIHVTSR